MTMHNSSRLHGRACNQVRPIRISYDPYGYADASVLFEIGNTKVLCSVTLQQGVPPFLKGKKTGWLKAEYAMLPGSTHQRSQRESSSADRNGRSVEISRLIGRSLRAVVDLAALGENTIVVDCDVLQADGGTRTAAITGASVALMEAASRWRKAGKIGGPVIVDQLGAISLGIAGDTVLLDIDCAEDNTIDADFNVILTRSGGIVEIQGTAEKHAVSWQSFAQLQELARAGVQDLFAACDAARGVELNDAESAAAPKKSAAPLFSLQNRIQKSL